jgi:hypothetical protein
MKTVRWTLIVAIALGVYLGIEITSCRLENRCNPLVLETCEP